MNKSQNNIEKIVSSVDPLLSLDDHPSHTNDPMNDSAFKIALDYYNIFFIELVQFTTGKEISNTVESAVGSESTLTVKGKTIRLDSLKNTDEGYFNVEGQIQGSKFTIKRQISYVTIIFASQLQEGDDYDVVTPVTVIVFYKDRGKSKPLIQKANLAGDLLDEEDTQYLNLISVNTAKWRAADNEKFKHYLALLHLGVDEEVLSENGIDITDTGFQELRQKLVQCCIEHAMNKAKKEGDVEMKKMLTTLLREEGIEIGTEKGIEIGTEKGIEIGTEKGIEIGTINIYYNEMQLTPEEIAERMSIPLERVAKTIKTLQFNG